MAKDPTVAAQKWATNLASAGPSIQAGIMGVQTAPGALAARQKEVWATNTINAKDKWAKRVSAIGLSEWQQAAIQKGLPRIASGAQAAQPKMQQFLTAFLPYVERGVSALPPRGGLEQNIARSAAMIRHNAQFNNS